MRDIQPKRQKDVDEQNELSVREDKGATPPALERKVCHGVDEIFEGVSVDPELAEHPQLVPEKERVTNMTPQRHSFRNSTLPSNREFWRCLYSVRLMRWLHGLLDGNQKTFPRVVFSHDFMSFKILLNPEEKPKREALALFPTRLKEEHEHQNMAKLKCQFDK